MNVAQVIAHLESRFGQREETGIEPQDVEDWIPTALEKTKEWATANGHRADVQYQAAAALADEGDGSASAAIPSDILAGRITCINHESSPFDFADVHERGGLALVFADLMGHFAIESTKVFVVGPSEAGNPLTGDLLITGLAPQTLGTLSDKLVPYFLDQLEAMAVERKGLKAPQTAAAA